MTIFIGSQKIQTDGEVVVVFTDEKSCIYDGKALANLVLNPDYVKAVTTTYLKESK